MTLFVNCRWYSPADAGIHSRVEQLAPLLVRKETAAVVGGNWYRLGRSKKQALSKPLSLAELGKISSWTRWGLAPGENHYSLGAWNGRDEPEGVSLLVRIHEPPTTADTLLFDGPRLDSVKAKWREVLVWAEAVAHHLGGWSVVSSNELMDWAKGEGMERPDLAAYAAFGGQDDASTLPRAHVRGLRSIVSAATWPEVIAPNRGRVQELIDTRSSQVATQH